MSKKTKEEITAEIDEIKQAVDRKQAEYTAALQAGQPAGGLLIELTRLQNRLAVYQAMGGLEIVLLERAEIVKNDLAEQQKKMEEMKGG